MHLGTVVDRVTRPVCCLALAVLLLSTALTARGPVTPHYSQYTALFWTAVCVAVLALVPLVLTPIRVQRAFRTSGLVLAGVLSALVAGNGLTSATARAGFVTASVVTLALAVPALIDRLESSQQRSVRRL